jgi:putative transposase
VTVYRHISAERAHCELPVSLMCELLGVSESGYWAWRKRPPSDRALTDAWLTERIRQVHVASKGRYGSPRVHAVPRRQGIRVGEKRVARLMALAGLQGAHQRRRRRGCTVHVEGVAPFRDLVGRDFRPDAPDRVWAADIKQIRTGEGWLYLAAVQDLFSRRIVGWAMAAHMRFELVVAALEMAVGRRRPAQGTVHHSDHGAAVHRTGLRPELPRRRYRAVHGRRRFLLRQRGRRDVLRHDDQGAVAPRHPKGEWITPAELRSTIFEFIEGYYNPTRLHSTLGMRSPVEYEADHAPATPTGSRARARARARAENLCTTFGCAQLRRQQQPDSTETGEVQLAGIDQHHLLFHAHRPGRRCGGRIPVCPGREHVHRTSGSSLKVGPETRR